MPQQTSSTDADVIHPNPIFNDNKLKIGIFGLNGKGTANTLVPEVHKPTWSANLRAARLADRIGLEAIVPYSRWKGHEVGKLDHPSGVVLDPYTWAAGIAQATEHAAVFVTSHAPTIHPVTAAKQLATIDIISGGRLGLNVVGGWNKPELEMFGAPLKEHDQRYEHLAEWFEIIERLWTEDEEFDYQGEFFTILRGGSRPRPVQRPRPAIMNAGSSGKGREFALKYADMCFVQIGSDDPEKQRAQVDSYKQMAREQFGREIQVWIMATIIQRDTQAEADDYLRYYAVDNQDVASVDGWMKGVLAQTQSMARPAIEAMRLRAAATAGGSIITGDADGVADRLKALSDVGVDGLLLGFVDFPAELERLQANTLPRLEALGLRRPFAGTAHHG